MTCWKTVNISRELGHNRLAILSVLVGILSFSVLYVPFSIIYKGVTIFEPSIYHVMIGLLLIPVLHKLGHAIPILFTDREFYFKWSFKYQYLPMLKIRVRSNLSKRTSILMVLAPSLFLTVPLLFAATVFPTLYPLLLLFTAINIAISVEDWYTLAFFIKAPKKCVVTKTKNNYDILIQP
ncbi:hypothetical protein CEY16_00490 [Halalkalibacillus sediminis]|uniref:DUF3267 domain-containing protein n=1 Tax=Halalkalibacillus sediminis TaxID=2018042 RepID=A0A2I0QV99_9BACI|nr:DUF3267 domain-containing protein [Halalkalibacillus sediminis]PKR78271.1 hypothetical protein CEY16_00490 [Halalkalibacillus sediminis]